MLWHGWSRDVLHTPNSTYQPLRQVGELAWCHKSPPTSCRTLESASVSPLGNTWGGAKLVGMEAGELAQPLTHGCQSEFARAVLESSPW